MTLLSTNILRHVLQILGQLETVDGRGQHFPSGHWKETAGRTEDIEMASALYRPSKPVTIRLTWQHVDETIFELVTREVRADEMRRVHHLRRNRQPLNKLHI